MTSAAGGSLDRAWCPASPHGGDATPLGARGRVRRADAPATGRRSSGRCRPPRAAQSARTPATAVTTSATATARPPTVAIAIATVRAGDPGDPDGRSGCRRPRRARPAQPTGLASLVLAPPGDDHAADDVAHRRGDVVGGGPPGRVVGGHGLEERPPLAGQVVGNDRRPMQARERRLDRAPGVLALAAQGLEEHEAERVHVARGADLLAPRLLGRDVGGRAHDGAVAREPRSVGELGDAEVGELGHERVAERRHLRDEDVLGLDVAVHDAVPVHVAERIRHLRADVRDLSRLHRTSCEAVGERASLDVLHDDVAAGDALVHEHAGVVDADEAGMVQPAEQPDLALPALQVGDGVVVGSEHLHRDVAAEFGVTGTVDVGHAAGAEVLPEVVALSVVVGRGCGVCESQVAHGQLLMSCTSRVVAHSASTDSCVNREYRRRPFVPRGLHVAHRCRMRPDGNRFLEVRTSGSAHPGMPGGRSRCR